MTEAETQILLTKCDHTLSTTLAQLRLIVAHVTPVANGLLEGSADKGYLVKSLAGLHQLHGYLLEQLNQLNALSVSSARNVAAQGQTAAEHQPGTSASHVPPDNGAPCTTNLESMKPEFSVH
ncbi:hypothetical protein [Ralstonia sp. UBA689]|uniref:hypothetical protein n=1 Tax=Ralstonia sp. UBA689 TaxID=1947373 RepID=UPI0025E91375|nr:hypothetical protein [Ralstonia sp. UBA689]